MLVAASRMSLRTADLPLVDWRASARARADPDTRSRLLAPQPAPPPDVEL
jgi:hypothetical protein